MKAFVTPLNTNGSRLTSWAATCSHADDTPIRVLDRSLRESKGLVNGVRQGRIWALLVAEPAPMGGGIAPPGAVYRFAPPIWKEEQCPWTTWLMPAVSFRQNGITRVYWPSFSGAWT